MRTIRASEIGSYLYCQKAWFYQKQGVPSENKTELAAGSEVHQQHGRRVFRSQLVSYAGWLILAAALVILVIYLIRQVT